MQVKTQEEMFNIFKSNNPEFYSKFGVVSARKGNVGEKVDTIINGELETTNTVTEPSAILKGPLNEEYIVKLDKFKKLYEGEELTDDFQKYKAKGKVYAIEYTGDDIKFNAAWGEEMIIKKGDMLCSPDKDHSGDVYRIEKEAFNKTYEKDKPNQNFSDKLKSALSKIKDENRIITNKNSLKI